MKPERLTKAKKEEYLQAKLHHLATYIVSNNIDSYEYLIKEFRDIVSWARGGGPVFDPMGKRRGKRKRVKLLVLVNRKPFI